MDQGTPEWFAARVGKVTASRVADVIAKTRSGYAASRANYMAQLIVERLTGEPQDTFTTAAMQWGIEKEPEARTAYEFYSGVSVEQVGFIDHPRIEMAGASPDGLVDAGLVEIKCPNTATHIETLLSEKVPKKYITQMQWQMACTGRVWCDFVTFDPRLPEDMAIWIHRVERDDEAIADMEAEVETFLRDLDEKLEQLRERAA